MSGRHLSLDLILSLLLVQVRTPVYKRYSSEDIISSEPPQRTVPAVAGSEAVSERDGGKVSAQRMVASYMERLNAFGELSSERPSAPPHIITLYSTCQKFSYYKTDLHIQAIVFAVKGWHDLDSAK
eukprot:g52972.t1